MLSWIKINNIYYKTSISKKVQRQASLRDGTLIACLMRVLNSFVIINIQSVSLCLYCKNCKMKIIKLEIDFECT